MLFAFHTMRMDLLEKTVHILLLYTVYGCIISTAVEMLKRQSVCCSCNIVHIYITYKYLFLPYKFRSITTEIHPH